ncbi:MAG: hypothetical protein ABIR79_13175 [Candidatus Binatia bacterium]
MRLPHAKAFVVQLGEPADVPRTRLLGRVEHVATGRALRFGSRRELFAFFQQCCPATPPKPGRVPPTS